MVNDIISKIDKPLLETFYTADRQPQIYKDLINELSSLGINAVLISAIDKNKSSCAVSCKTKKGKQDASRHKSVPIIDIYIRSNINYETLHIDERSNNWASTYIHTNNIREIWKMLLNKYSIEKENYYDPDMLIFFRNTSKYILTGLVYSQRDEIKKLIYSKQVISIKPKYIYSSSFPGYSVIYDSENDYLIAKEKNEFYYIENIITSKIVYLLPEEYKMDLKLFLKNHFYHCEMKDISLYGLSRQD
jgi:hypothetical protein